MPTLLNNVAALIGAPTPAATPVVPLYFGQSGFYATDDTSDLLTDNGLGDVSTWVAQSGLSVDISPSGEVITYGPQGALVSVGAGGNLGGTAGTPVLVGDVSITYDLQTGDTRPCAWVAASSVDGVSWTTVATGTVAADNYTDYNFHDNAPKPNFKTVVFTVGANCCYVQFLIYPSIILTPGSTPVILIVSDFRTFDGSITGGTPPAAPVASINPTCSGLVVSWAAVSGAMIYNLYRGTSPGSETLLVSGVTGTSYTDTAVTPGTVYYYRVTAVNASGESAQSAEVSATEIGVPGVPSFTRAGLCNGQVLVTIFADSGASSYNLYRGASISGPFTRVASSLPSGAYTDAPGDGLWYYEATAVNVCGESAPDGPYRIRTRPSLPPITDLSATQNAATGVVTLTWTDIGADSYNLLRGTSPVGPFTLLQSGISPGVTDTPPRGVSVYYQVEGVGPCNDVSSNAFPETLPGIVNCACTVWTPPAPCQAVYALALAPVTTYTPASILATVWTRQGACAGTDTLPMSMTTIFRPENYGALMNGSTDDTAAFQSCAAAASLVGGTIVVTGKTILTGTIVTNNCDIVFATSDSAIEWAGASGPCWEIDGRAGRIMYVFGVNITGQCPTASSPGGVYTLPAPNAQDGVHVVGGPVHFLQCNFTRLYRAVNVDNIGGHVYFSYCTITGYFGVWFNVNTGDMKFNDCLLAAYFACIGYGDLGLSCVIRDSALSFSPFGLYQKSIAGSSSSNLGFVVLDGVAFESIGNVAIYTEYADLVESTEGYAATADLRIGGCTGFSQNPQFTLAGHSAGYAVMIDGPKGYLNFDLGINGIPLAGTGVNGWGGKIFANHPSATTSRFFLTYRGASSADIITPGGAISSTQVTAVGNF